MNLEDMIGENIVAVDTVQKETIKFYNDKEEVYTLNAYGDCCSYSWFEHFDGQENLINAKITKVDHKDMGDSFEDNHSSYIQCYFTTIHTTKGYVDIEMRNSSNGYYGGYIELSKSYLNNPKISS